MSPYTGTVNDEYEIKQKRLQDIATADEIREKVIEHSKTFKVSWIELAQYLYAVYVDKLFYGWGYEKFEHYCDEEVGIKKTMAVKLIKTYQFLEQEEPACLSKEYAETREAVNVPGVDQLVVLKSARQNKDLDRKDYAQIRKRVFEEGRDASTVRKELTAMIRERKAIDPEEEREQRNSASLRRMVNAIRSFEKDMETLKLSPEDLLKDAKSLMRKIRLELGESQDQ